MNTSTSVVGYTVGWMCIGSNVTKSKLKVTVRENSTKMYERRDALCMRERTALHLVHTFQQYHQFSLVRYSVIQCILASLNSLNRQVYVKAKCRVIRLLLFDRLTDDIVQMHSTSYISRHYKY
ncbi:hypothetical protein ACTXT7_015081 [Hymenolepis weldensis]